MIDENQARGWEFHVIDDIDEITGQAGLVPTIRTSDWIFSCEKSPSGLWGHTVAPPSYCH